MTVFGLWARSSPVAMTSVKHLWVPQTAAAVPQRIGAQLEEEDCEFICLVEWNAHLRLRAVLVRYQIR